VRLLHSSLLFLLLLCCCFYLLSFFQFPSLFFFFSPLLKEKASDDASGSSAGPPSLQGYLKAKARCLQELSAFESAPEDDSIYPSPQGAVVVYVLYFLLRCVFPFCCCCCFWTFADGFVCSRALAAQLSISCFWRQRHYLH